MQKVLRHRHTAKLTKAGPSDERGEAEAVRRLLGAGASAAPRSSSGPQRAAEGLATVAPGAPSGSPASDGGRTCVERLRDRLGRLSLEAGAAVLLGPDAPADWLPGRPCALEPTKCVEAIALCGVELHLPFAPLPPQIAVAERVLQACEHGSVALLDSPTGTGKSIALLSSALAWQRQAFERHGAAPQIIYGVRTHAQLAQLVAELQKTPYRPRMAVLGSREQLCINTEVKVQAARQRVSLNLMCRQATRRTHQSQAPSNSGTCPCGPYEQLGGMSHAKQVFERCARPGKLWDVEDLVQVAKSSGRLGGCPYYTAHVLAGDADIVICPHNYVLDPAVSQCKSHHRQRWSLRERIVILDEAHNVEQGCREAGSVEASLQELRSWATALDALAARRPHIRVRARGRDLPCREACQELRHLPELLAVHLEALRAGGAGAAPGQVAAGVVHANAGAEPLPGLASADRIWGLPGHPAAGEFLVQAGVSARGTLSRGTEELAVELADRLLRAQASGEAVAEDAVLLGVLGRLQEVITKLRLAALHPESYVFCARLGGAQSDSKTPSFAAWLMSPGVVFDTFATQARAVILASGTLAPLGALAAELASSEAFAARAQPAGPLEAGHVVAPGQVLVAAVGQLPGSGRALVSTFSSWRCPAFLTELGTAIAGILRAVPGGVLCFFPSYAALEACTTVWQSAPAAHVGVQSGVWGQLLRVKAVVVVEPRDSNSLSQARRTFEAAARGAGGALCLAVYRGKMSEGLSFDDELCRAVLCIGVPYPLAKDPLVVAKRRWNDARRAGGARGSLSGDEWYELQAYRAVNQALGRCVRHRLDHGALLLLDARWAAAGNGGRGLRRYLARWLQPLLEELPSPGAGGQWGWLFARLQELFTVAPQIVEARRSAEAQHRGLARVPPAVPVPVPQLVAAPAGPVVRWRPPCGPGSDRRWLGAVPNPGGTMDAKRLRLGAEADVVEDNTVLPIREATDTQTQGVGQRSHEDSRSRTSQLESALQSERARTALLQEELRRREAECAELRARCSALRAAGVPPVAASGG